MNSEPVEIDPNDRGLLETIGRLRVEAWSAFDPSVRDRTECWLDEFELSARHWVCFNNGTPIAAARMSVHKQVHEVPNAEIFEGVFQNAPLAPFASFNRLVVHPDHRGRALSRKLDEIRIKAATQSGYQSILGETHSGASRIAQLKALGFRIIGPARPYPPKHFLRQSGIVFYRDLTDGQSGGIRETINRMGWSSDVLNEISQKFVEYSAGCSNPVLDIGTAYGVAAIPAIERGATVVANDMNQHHLEELRARIPACLQARLTTIQGRFPEDLSFANESFDAIHASQVFHFLTPSEIIAGLEQVFRWLRPGGRLFLLAATPYQATHREFAPLFLQRKGRGDLWPGIIENLREYNKHWSVELSPPWLHVFDEEVLSGAVKRAGFQVEYSKLFSRLGLPEFVRLDGRENLGLIASKP